MPLIALSSTVNYLFNFREQLLVVLLTIAKHVLEDKIVEPKSSSFAAKLAPEILQVHQRMKMYHIIRCGLYCTELSKNII